MSFFLVCIVLTVVVTRVVTLDLDNPHLYGKIEENITNRLGDPRELKLMPLRLILIRRDLKVRLKVNINFTYDGKTSFAFRKLCFEGYNTVNFLTNTLCNANKTLTVMW